MGGGGGGQLGERPWRCALKAFSEGNSSESEALDSSRVSERFTLSESSPSWYCLSFLQSASSSLVLTVKRMTSMQSERLPRIVFVVCSHGASVKRQTSASVTSEWSAFVQKRLHAHAGRACSHVQG